MPDLFGRRLPLLIAGLAAVSLSLTCMPGLPEYQMKDIVQNTVVVPAHDCMEFRATLTNNMILSPVYPAEFYVTWEVRNAVSPHDTLSDYVMTFDNWLAFNQNLPCEKITTHHASSSGDYYIDDLDHAGDYSFVLDNRADEVARTVRPSLVGLLDQELACAS